VADPPPSIVSCYHKFDSIQAAKGQAALWAFPDPNLYELGNIF